LLKIEEILIKAQQWIQVFQVIHKYYNDVIFK